MKKIKSQNPLSSHQKRECTSNNFSAIEPILSQFSHNWQQYSSGKDFKPPKNTCEFCGGEFRLNVVADKRSKQKYLRAGCCDSYLRLCPDADELLRSPILTSDERDYLQRVATLPWFSGQVAAVLIQLEAKAQGGEV